MSQPEVDAIDNGYVSPETITGLEEQGIGLHIAAGCELHNRNS